MARSGRDHNGMRCFYIRRPREVRSGRHELAVEKHTIGAGDTQDR
jgi:hypothetical protein